MATTIFPPRLMPVDAGAPSRYRDHAMRASPDELDIWEAEVADLLARAAAGDLFGSMEDNCWFLFAQRDAIAAERVWRSRSSRQVRPAGPSRRYPAEALAAIRRQINLVHLIENRGHLLYESGKTWRGACFFCQATNPTTLTIWRDPDGSERFRCWRCAAGGDVFTAVMALDRLSFPQAVTGLAAICDVDLSPPIEIVYAPAPPNGGKDA